MEQKIGKKKIQEDLYQLDRISRKLSSLQIDTMEIARNTRQRYNQNEAEPLCGHIIKNLASVSSRIVFHDSQRVNTQGRVFKCGVGDSRQFFSRVREARDSRPAPEQFYRNNGVVNGKTKDLGIIIPEEYQQAELAGTLTIAEGIVCSYCQDPVEIHDPLQFHCKQHRWRELRMFDNPGYPAVGNEYYGTMMFYLDVIPKIPLEAHRRLLAEYKSCPFCNRNLSPKEKTLILPNNPFLVINVASRFVSGMLTRGCVFSPNRNISPLGMRPMSRDCQPRQTRTHKPEKRRKRNPMLHR